MYSSTMKFRITRHSTSSPPDDALDRLSERLGNRREEVFFAARGSEIRATLRAETPVAMTSDERTEIGRRAVLDVVKEVCERVPDLKFDWFAVGPAA
jgi:hypothetical protein